MLANSLVLFASCPSYIKTTNQQFETVIQRPSCTCFELTLQLLGSMGKVEHGPRVALDFAAYRLQIWCVPDKILERLWLCRFRSFTILCRSAPSITPRAVFASCPWTRSPLSVGLKTKKKAQIQFFVNMKCFGPANRVAIGNQGPQSFCSLLKKKMSVHSCGDLDVYVDNGESDVYVYGLKRAVFFQSWNNATEVFPPYVVRFFNRIWMQMKACILKYMHACLSTCIPSLFVHGSNLSWIRW